MACWLLAITAPLRSVLSSLVSLPVARMATIHARTASSRSAGSALPTDERGRSLLKGLPEQFAALRVLRFGSHRCLYLQGNDDILPLSLQYIIDKTPTLFHLINILKIVQG
jgi:hypothetical protein